MLGELEVGGGAGDAGTGEGPRRGGEVAAPRRGHPPRGLHAAMCDAYRDTRYAAEYERETHCIGYRAEERQWQQDHPMPTFRRWLEGGGWDGFRRTEPIR